MILSEKRSQSRKERSDSARSYRQGNRMIRVRRPQCKRYALRPYRIFFDVFFLNLWYLLCLRIQRTASCSQNWHKVSQGLFAPGHGTTAQTSREYVTYMRFCCSATSRLRIFFTDLDRLEMIQQILRLFQNFLLSFRPA